MNLTSMAMTAEEAKAYNDCEVVPGDAPKFPYGLSIELSDESLKKLGIEPPAVGAVLLVMAHVQVTSVSQNQQLDGDKESRCSLQITEMALSAPTKDPADSLWPNA